MAPAACASIAAAAICAGVIGKFGWFLLKRLPPVTANVRITLRFVDISVSSVV